MICCRENEITTADVYSDIIACAFRHHQHQVVDNILQHMVDKVTNYDVLFYVSYFNYGVHLCVWNNQHLTFTEEVALTYIQNINNTQSAAQGHGKNDYCYRSSLYERAYAHICLFFSVCYRAYMEFTKGMGVIVSSRCV